MFTLRYGFSPYPIRVFPVRSVHFPVFCAGKLLADQLKLSSLVGLTHWQEGGQNADMPGATPQTFFAPDIIQKRIKELGAQEFQATVGAALAKMYDFADQHIEIVIRSGQDGVESVYQEMLAGKGRIGAPDKDTLENYFGSTQYERKE